MKDISAVNVDGVKSSTSLILVEYLPLLHRFLSCGRPQNIKLPPLQQMCETFNTFGSRLKYFAHTVWQGNFLVIIRALYGPRLEIWMHTICFVMLVASVPTCI